MRRLLAAVLGVALAAPAWADDPPAAKAGATAKSVREQLNDISQAFQKEVGDLKKQFSEAKTDAEKKKIQVKAVTEVMPKYADQMVTLAAAHPGDPAAVEAALMACSIYQRQEDGDRRVRAAREKLAQGPKLVAGFFLAEALKDKDDPTPEQTKEAEALLAEVVAGLKTVKGLPEQQAQELAQQAEASLKDLRTFAVGKVAPAAESKDLDDKPVKLADHKGKVVVLDFWATWCGPCKGMIPHERAMVKKHAGKPFVFVSVSADDEAKTVKEFVEKEPMPWVHWFGGPQAGVVRDWNIRAFPTLYVIDAKGVIRGKIVGGGPKSEKKLEELVDKLVKEASSGS